jgi:predicted ribosomally synthesized peptide with SipW-like signal peptide
VNNTTETKRQRGRKVAAILAGGLVLGVGTMATLASWSDNVNASATFTAGKFNLEGTVDNSTWAEHPAATPGALAFTLPVSAGNLTPGDTTYAAYAVRLDKTTTTAAKVTITASSTNTVSNLTYSLIQPTAFGCDATTTGTTLVSSSAVGAVTGAQTFNLAVGAPPSTAGAPAYLCFKVTAGAGITQGQSGTGTWTFTAVSQ